MLILLVETFVLFLLAGLWFEFFKKQIIPFSNLPPEKVFWHQKFKVFLSFLLLALLFLFVVVLSIFVQLGLLIVFVLSVILWPLAFLFLIGILHFRVLLVVSGFLTVAILLHYLLNYFV